MQRCYGKLIIDSISSRTFMSSSIMKSAGLKDFFDAKPGKDGNPPPIGRAWEAWELRQKGFPDLHKLWYVLLKEKNMLYSKKQMAASARQQFTESHRIIKVRKSMCRIKQVLTERALSETDSDKQFVYKKFINDM